MPYILLSAYSSLYTGVGEKKYCLTLSHSGAVFSVNRPGPGSLRLPSGFTSPINIQSCNKNIALQKVA